jgi:hypothetical protein
MAEYKKNNWVRFLRQYGPVATNDNQYDEHTANCAKRNGVRALRFDSGGLRDELIDNFRAASPQSVILTGTAGDGKTFLCREVWEELGGDRAAWSGEGKFRKMQLAGGATLHVIKDLTELTLADAVHLAPMADALSGAQGHDVWLIAANDGQLLQAWSRVPSSPAVDGARALIEELLVQGALRTSKGGLRLYNLSRQPSAELMRRALDAVAAHEGWRGCDGCAGQSDDPALRCPVWENHQRLQIPLLRERLTDLLELGDRSGSHIPVRQLLIVTSNMLLGHPGVKDNLLRCDDVPTVLREHTAHRASLYRNAFGENLPEGRREHGSVFSALRRFGIGEETSNRIDNLLIYGQDDPALHTLFRELFVADAMYGANEEFQKYLSAYLDGSDAEKSASFTSVAVAQRQRLFFTLSPARAAEFGLWELTVFQHAGEYLDRVLRPLLRGERAEALLVKRLVRGLNRVFTGMLTSEDEHLWLASSGSHSQARVCRIAEHAVPVAPSLGRRVALERSESGDGVELAVYLRRDRRLTMPLHLVRYEFLARVSEGALPSNFSRECYEDILSFKSRLLRAWRLLDSEDQDAASFRLEVLELTAEGKLSSRGINLQLEPA